MGPIGPMGAEAKWGRHHGNGAYRAYGGRGEVGASPWQRGLWGRHHGKEAYGVYRAYGAYGVYGVCGG